MTGREIFKKYESIFDVLVKIEYIFPRKVREWQFNSIRMKSGKSVIFLRYILIRTLAKKVGKNVSIFQGVYLENIEELIIGDNVSIHQMCYLDAEGGLEIGDDVSIGHRCTILSSNHRYDLADVPIKYQGMILKKTILKNNIWIGCGTTILPGITIDTGCVVGSNSTVTKSIEKNSVVVGNPAKIIKKRIK